MGEVKGNSALSPDETGTAAAEGSGPYCLAVDVGGTFIDLALRDESTGELVFEKQLARPETIADEVLAGVARMPVEVGALDRMAHGTTVAVNTILQERGARVGLITTKGFRDVLAIGRGGRRQIYNVLYVPPAPLVPRYLRREVAERTAADGSELIPLDTDAVEREAAYLAGHGVEAIAVVFLHAYADPRHEREAAALIASRHPELAVTASSDLAREWREFERTSTAVLNAYVQPRFADFVAKLESRLRESKYERPLAIMQSNGGIRSAARAAAQPIRTLMSGPAGGVMGAQALASALHLDHVICADVGGTSFDVALIEDGSVMERATTEIAGRPILGPLVDIVSIGAGGGSVAWLDRGVIQVGPRSAGASPGPACFGLGGDEPTVTDCHLLLGRLDPAAFLGSRLPLDAGPAERALRERIAAPLGLSLEAAADGVLAIAETSMTNAIRKVTIARGLDPRDFALLAYAGGGGFFAAALAEELEIPRVVIPRAPANFSAWGILTSDYRDDATLTRVQPLTTASGGEIAAAFAELAGQVVQEVASHGFDPASIEVLYRADIRYAGQEHPLVVPLEVEWLADAGSLAASLGARFIDQHQKLYGHGLADGELEIVTRRCRAVGQVPRASFAAWAPTRPAAAAVTRPVYFRQAGYVDAAIHDRERLPAGASLLGPAIVEEWTTTIVVPPSWRGDVDEIGTLVLSPAAKAAQA
jgi:N-methylhydantoinase A